MNERKISSTEQKLVQILVREIWMLANLDMNTNHTVKRLERLGAAAYLLEKHITDEQFPDRDISQPICQAIREEIDVLSNC
jgi:hypothetical protein